MLPIGLVLLLLTGVGPLMAWRKSTVRNMLHQFLWPTLAAIVTASALIGAGVRVWSSGICFSFAAFVFTSLGQEFVRGVKIRRDATSADVLTAAIGLVARSKRRYGGYLV